MLIFAYGSNMCSARLRKRVPSAVARGPAVLAGYQLRFHKRSEDQSAKADAFRTGDPNDRVWGVVFEINPSDKPALDRAEGLHHGYDEANMPVCLDKTEVSVQLYLAQVTAIAPGLRPYSWYARYVIAGAIEHGLRSDYIDGIRAVPVIEDPNVERHAREWLPLPGDLKMVGPDGSDGVDESRVARSIRAVES